MKFLRYKYSEGWQLNVWKLQINFSAEEKTKTRDWPAAIVFWWNGEFVKDWIFLKGNEK